MYFGLEGTGGDLLYAAYCGKESWIRTGGRLTLGRPICGGSASAGKNHKNNLRCGSNPPTDVDAHAALATTTERITTWILKNLTVATKLKNQIYEF